VPVSAIAVWQPVRTASISSSSRAEAVPSSITREAATSPSHDEGSPEGATTVRASPSAPAITAGAAATVVRWTVAV